MPTDEPIPSLDVWTNEAWIIPSKTKLAEAARRLEDKLITDHKEPELARYRGFAMQDRHGQAADSAGELGKALESYDRWVDAATWHAADVAHGFRRGDANLLCIALDRLGFCWQAAGEAHFGRAALAFTAMHAQATQHSSSRSSGGEVLKLRRYESLIRLANLHAERATLAAEATEEEGGDEDSAAAQCGKIVAARAIEAFRNAAIALGNAACSAARDVEAEVVRRPRLINALVDLASHRKDGSEHAEAIGLLLSAKALCDSWGSALGGSSKRRDCYRLVFYNLAQTLSDAGHWHEGTVCVPESSSDGRMSECAREKRPCRGESISEASAPALAALGWSLRSDGRCAPLVAALPSL